MIMMMTINSANSTKCFSVSELLILTYVQKKMCNKHLHSISMHCEFFLLYKTLINYFYVTLIEGLWFNASKWARQP